MEQLHWADGRKQEGEGVCREQLKAGGQDQILMTPSSMEVDICSLPAGLYFPVLRCPHHPDRQEVLGWDWSPSWLNPKCRHAQSEGQKEL